MVNSWLIHDNYMLNDMKKEYMKPQAEVIKLGTHGMLAVSNPPEWSNEVGSRECSWDISDEDFDL